MDSSLDKWLPCDDLCDCHLNFCDEENGIFWGEVTQKEIEFVAKLRERRAINELNASTLDTTTTSGDISSIDEEVLKNMSMTSTIEPINISESVSPFVSPIGSDSSIGVSDSPSLSSHSKCLAEPLSPIYEENGSSESSDLSTNELNTTFTINDKSIGAELTISSNQSPFNSTVDHKKMDEIKEIKANESINLFSNDSQMENIYVKPSEEKHLLDQTIDQMPFETRTLFDKSIEVNAQDLLSPFNKYLAKSSVETPNGVAVTRSLVKLDTTIRSFRKSTPVPQSKTKSKIPKLLGFASPLPSRLTSQFNSSHNDSTLDFILNEIKCNTSEDSEEFLTNDKQLV